MPILYDNPREVGADRVVNGIAAYEESAAAKAAVIVVDFGTATTFDAVSREGRVPGRRDLSGSADLRGRAVSTRREAAAHRRPQAGRA